MYGCTQRVSSGHGNDLLASTCERSRIFPDRIGPPLHHGGMFYPSITVITYNFFAAVRSHNPSLRSTYVTEIFNGNTVLYRENCFVFWMPGNQTIVKMKA